VTEKNQSHREQQQSHAFLRNDPVDEPFNQERRNKSEQTTSSDRKKTGQMPMEQWPNPLDQPDEFGRQSKPMGPSLVCDRGQRAATRISA
jgi:hypothetical protein